MCNRFPILAKGSQFTAYTIEVCAHRTNITTHELIQTNSSSNLSCIVNNGP